MATIIDLSEVDMMPVVRSFLTWTSTRYGQHVADLAKVAIRVIEGPNSLSTKGRRGKEKVIKAKLSN